MAAHQAPLSLGFSRQEQWSGLPFPSPMHERKSESEVAWSCPTLCYPMDCSLPGSSVHGIFQARVLEWGAIAYFQISWTEDFWMAYGFVGSLKARNDPYLFCFHVTGSLNLMPNMFSILKHLTWWFSKFAAIRISWEDVETHNLLPSPHFNYIRISGDVIYT